MASLIQLSPEQAAAESDVIAGRSVLVTGPAGSGKSLLLNRLREQFGHRLSVTASTGIAALNVGGVTLNSFAGLMLGTESAAEMSARIIDAKGKHYRNIRGCSILAVDEISMISGELLAKVDTVFRTVRTCSQPFGGVQLILFGDFLQLPPVSKRTEPTSFAFECDAWQRAGIVRHVFTKVFRQADQAFADALGRLRVGDIYHPSVEMFAGRNNRPQPNDGIRAVIIHTHNVDVDRLNLVELQKLPGADRCYISEDTGSEAWRQRLDNDCLAPRELRLRIGAQVMLLSNLDVSQGLANGSLGIVVNLSEDEVHVAFGSAEVVNVPKRRWEIKNGLVVEASRDQFPLRLAYAMTCHKTQGMTLDRIECHLGDTFTYGQAYVAVSRVKTLDGLFLRNSSRKAFRAHPKAVAFYQAA